MSWQLVAVAVIEVLAVGFLLYSFFGPSHGARPTKKPDVKVGDLVRKRQKRDESDGSEP